MRAGRVLLLALAGLVLLAAGCAWLLPGALDWNRFRPEIERLASGALGRQVHIGGAIALDLLPEPALTAGGLNVEDSGDGIALQARELRLRVALGPLLAGRLHVRSMVLQGPALHLPWPLPPGTIQGRADWLRSAHAEIRDGTMQLGAIALTGIDAEFSTDPNTGTLAGSGVASLGGRTWRFTARLAQPGRDGAAGLEVSLDGEGPLQGTGGRFSGAVAADGTLAGHVSGRGRDLSLLVPAPAVAWQGSGSLSAAGGLLIADDLALQLGGSPARGVIALRVGEGARLDLALAAGRLDLDAWLPVLAHAPKTTLPTGIDLSAEAATLAGGTLRRLRGGFDLADGTTAVRDASAVLPGGAMLTLSGQAAPGYGGAPGFRGAGRLAAPDLRATLRWAGGFVPGLGDVLPDAALRDANFTGTVAVAPGEFTLLDLHGTLDGARIEGNLGLSLAPRPLVTAKLALDGLALDPWLPRPDALATGYPWPSLAQHFARLGVDLAIRAHPARWAGVPLDAFELDAHFDQHGARIRHFAAAGRGVRIALSGSLAEGGRIADGVLDLTAKDAAALRGLLPPEWDQRRLLSGPAEIHLRASGPSEALGVRAEASLGDLRLEVQPLLNMPSGSWAGPISVRHPGAPRLLAQLGLPNAGAWLGDGSLSLVAQASATRNDFAVRDAVLTAGVLRVNGTVAVRLRGGPLRVTGDLSAESLPLPSPDLRSSDPLPLGLLHGWEAAIEVHAKEVLFGLNPALTEVASRVALQDGILRLDAVKASMAGGMLDGTLVLETGADPPRLAVEGRVAGAQLAGPVFGTPLDVRAGTVSLHVNLGARGYSPAALLSTLSGQFDAALRDGVATGFDVMGAGASLAADTARRDKDARAALQGGTTAFSTLDAAAQLRDGVATFTTAHLAGPSGAAVASGSVDLPGGTLDLRLALRPAEPPEAPELAVSLSGPAAAPRRIPDLAEFVRWSLAQAAQ